MFMLSGDTETTGLDSKKNQLLEAGFVLVDTSVLINSPVIMEGQTLVNTIRNFPTFQVRILHNPDKLVFNDFILNMNRDFIYPLIRDYESLDKLTDDELFEKGYCRPDKVMHYLFKFLFDNKAITEEEFKNLRIKSAFNFLGKNFTGFDKPFLESCIDFSRIKARHRVADPCALYYDPRIDDEALPDLGTCLKRSGLFPEDYNVKHTSVEDAQDTAIVFFHKVLKNLDKSSEVDQPELDKVE
ncbi:3'-5' exonuclease [Yersinia phage vB_Yru_GN1]|uniref:3'-5' exonuclease n=1 Tax=Yersinia phage vB_Yru_GN1 TaxID=3074381 RepID=A0AA86IYZ8_9CAUD|nr:3'-5' exonuclease [Yersinia phage vB_Yru_GN1]